MGRGLPYIWLIHRRLDINPNNIMLTIDDEFLLHDFEQKELCQPSPTKVIDSSRTIYGSRALGLPNGDLWGQPALCDPGEARIGRDKHRGLIQPELYRAPEVIFNMGWNTSVDIWNVGVLVNASLTMTSNPQTVSNELP